MYITSCVSAYSAWYPNCWQYPLPAFLPICICKAEPTMKSRMKWCANFLVFAGGKKKKKPAKRVTHTCVVTVNDTHQTRDGHCQNTVLYFQSSGHRTNLAIRTYKLYTLTLHSSDCCLQEAITDLPLTSPGCCCSFFSPSGLDLLTAFAGLVIVSGESWLYFPKTCK